MKLPKCIKKLNGRCISSGFGDIPYQEFTIRNDLDTLLIEEGKENEALERGNVVKRQEGHVQIEKFFNKLEAWNNIRQERG